MHVNKLNTEDLRVRCVICVDMCLLLLCRWKLNGK